VKRKSFIEGLMVPDSILNEDEDEFKDRMESTESASNPASDI